MCCEISHKEEYNTYSRETTSLIYCCVVICVCVYKCTIIFVNACNIPRLIIKYKLKE